MARSYTQLTCSERCQIYALKRSGKSAHAIGSQLQRDPEMIRREIKRNDGSKFDRYKQAQEKSGLRRRSASNAVCKMTDALKRSIESLLIEYQWSPEQISGWLAKEGRAHVSCDRIHPRRWSPLKAIRQVFGKITPLIHTITFDAGKEFAGH